MTESAGHDEAFRAWLKAMRTISSEDERFECSFGRFIVAFADTEAELYRVLVRYSQVSDPIARALFSGTRTRAMMDQIRSIAHNTAMSADRREDLEYVFVQLAAINTMRDHLVHHSSGSYSFRDPGKRVIANRRTSRYGNAKGYEVSAETVDSMTWDLYAIVNHLNMHWGRREGPFAPWRENPEDKEPTVWVYKGLQLIPSWERAPSSST